ncbi:GLPGLI family protein [Chryseobacterium lathyri]|nr:GLPGLI family protein [Chryseobacterium lathyri]
MKKNILLFCFTIFFSFSCNSQIHRFYYELTYKPSTRNKEMKNDLFYLDTLENQSVFIRKEKKETDSLLAANINFNPTFSSFGTMNFKVVKDTKNMTIILKDDLQAGVLSYKETIQLQWKLSQENKVLDNIKVQKAETDYGGRSWIAWFAADIPVFDGPYVFMGLPGLIVEMEDSANEYHWRLIGNKKISQSELQTETVMDGEGLISKEAYIKNKESLMKDPLPVLMQAMSEVTKDTKAMDNMRQQAEALKKYYQDNDNSIER